MLSRAGSYLKDITENPDFSWNTWNTSNFLLSERASGAQLHYQSHFFNAPSGFGVALVSLRPFQSWVLPQGYNGKSRLIVEYMEYKRLPFKRKRKYRSMTLPKSYLKRSFRFRCGSCSCASFPELGLALRLIRKIPIFRGIHGIQATSFRQEEQVELDYIA